MKFIILTNLKRMTFEKRMFVSFLFLTLSLTQFSFGQCPTVPVFTMANPTTCIGGTPTFQATSTGDPFTMVYSIVSGSAVIDATSGVASGVTGSFTVRATATNGCGSAFNDFPVTIASPTAPVISANGPTTFCGDESVTLSSDITNNIVWTTAETSASVLINGTGSYSATFTDIDGCTATSNSINVTVNPSPAQPTITANGPTSFCQGGSVLLSSSSNTGNVWSNSNLPPFTSTATSVQMVYGGSYTVTVTGPNGCTSTSDPVVVTINQNPIPVITPSGSNSICAGESVNLTASGTTGNVWSTNETTQMITVSTSSTITVTETDIHGCVGTSSPIEIIVNALPPAPTVTAAGSTTFCAGESVTLSSSEIDNVIWSDGTTTDPDLTVDAAGQYSVTFTDANGCESTSLPVTVVVNALPAFPTITANGPLTFCQGSDVTLTSSQSTGNVWSNNETTPTITISTSGFYTVSYTDANGCESTSAQTQVVVNQNPNPPIITANGPLSFCPGGSVVLTSSYSTGNFWSTTASTASITVNQADNYFVSYTDVNGCVATSNLTLVQALQAPTASASMVDAVTVQASPAGMSYQWIDCATNQGISLAFNQTFNPSQNGSYAVIVTNTSGCKDTSNCVNMNAVGINELQGTGKVKIFPNPTSEKFIVSLTDNSTELLDIVLFDATGKQVLTLTNQPSGVPLSVSDLEAGIYTVQVKHENGISMNRLVVE